VFVVERKSSKIVSRLRFLLAFHEFLINEQKLPALEGFLANVSQRRAKLPLRPRLASFSEVFVT
jgi:hypothetical protein